MPPARRFSSLSVVHGSVIDGYGFRSLEENQHVELEVAQNRTAQAIRPRCLSRGRPAKRQQLDVGPALLMPGPRHCPRAGRRRATRSGGAGSPAAHIPRQPAACGGPSRPTVAPTAARASGNQQRAVRCILNTMKPARAATQRFLPTSPFKPPPAPPPAEQFAVQDQVTHDKYGLGRVMSVDDDTALVIDFGTQHIRIMTPCAKLTKL